MANHPSRALAAEARRRVSRVFKTGSTDWGFRVTHPAHDGKDRICDIGSYQQAVEARQEALRTMLEALRERG
jgi:hypothetical protein